MTKNIDLIKSPFNTAFRKFAKSITTDCLVCAPYITQQPIKMLVGEISRTKNKSGRSVNINILTDISSDTALINGATDVSALLYLLDRHPKTSIISLPNLHAKVYISNKTDALITSANFTYGGENKNLEYGIQVSNPSIVKRIYSDIAKYQKSGVVVTKKELEEIHNQIKEIKKIAKQPANKVLVKKQQGLQKILKKVQAKNKRSSRKSTNKRESRQIFSAALLHILKKGPRKTEDIHPEIKAMRPDLCSDRKLVTGGVRREEAWKHVVRQQQTYLKRKGLIINDEKTKLWRLVKS